MFLLQTMKFLGCFLLLLATLAIVEIDADQHQLTKELFKQQDKALLDRVKKVIYALLYARLTYESEFPTAATSANISQQCKADSQLYYNSYTSLQNWALRSKLLFFYFK